MFYCKSFFEINQYPHIFLYIHITKNINKKNQSVKTKFFMIKKKSKISSKYIKKIDFNIFFCRLLKHFWSILVKRIQDYEEKLHV